MHLGKAHIVEILLERDANPNYIYPETGCPVIQAAIYNSNLAIAKMLINKGADCELEDSRGREAIFYTAKTWNMELVKLVREETGFIYDDDAYRTPAITAAIHSNWEVMVYMLENYSMAEIGDRQGRTPGLYAAANKNLSIVSNIFSKNKLRAASPDKKGRGLMHYAVAAGDSNMVAFLAGQGYLDAQDEEGATPLLYALAGARGYRDLGIEEMRERLVPPGRQYLTEFEPFSMPSPSAADYRAILRILVENGADVNLRTLDGISPLIGAAASADQAAIRLLLEYGANPYLKYNGKTPLDLAIEMKREPGVIKLLREAMR